MMGPSELPWTGERLVPSLSGDIVLEHLHRYALAADFVAGKDVLDIACGEGYGGNLLAAGARSVTGVDICSETVRHAQNKYIRPNLRFREGSCLAVPMPDRSVDVVVSFETLEHLIEQEQFLAEVRRVLRPDGILIVSTPDKTIYTGKLGNQNPFHPRELDASGFEKLLRERFAQVQILNQRVGLGSFLAPTAQGELIEVGTRRGNFEAVHFWPGVAEGVYLIGLASDAPLPPLKAGLFEFGREESEAFITPLTLERAAADALKRQGEELAKQCAELERGIADREGLISHLNAEMNYFKELKAWHEGEITRLQATISELKQVVESAERWQGRSWFTRAFHRWRSSIAEEEQRAGFFRRLERSIRKRRNGLLAHLRRQPMSNSRGGSGAPTQPPSATEGQFAEGKRRVLYISGEPDIPGHFYRVEMYAAAVASRGYSVKTIRADQIAQHLPWVEAAQVAVIWKAPWSDALAGALAVLKQNRAKVVFDVDDYAFDPALAKIEVIDGIRSQGFTESMLADYYRLIQKTLCAADACTCSTKPLAAGMRRFNKSVFVLPNGFDEERHRRSRRALAERRAGRSDGLVRIGYAGGTRTHQKDFVCAAPAVAQILREHSECRLVLFFSQAPGGMALLGPEEFPELKGLESQIEWRQAVPVRELPQEMARFDINLAPLEVGNLFCEAKSELKYFEAALVEVPTVASPTVPFVESIRPEESGFLAEEAKEWHAILKRLVSQPELRASVGQSAYRAVLPIYGPERRGELAAGVLEEVCGCAQNRT